MKKNIGTTDRIIRFIFGLIALAAVFFITSLILKIILIAVALFCFYQAIVGWCLLYQLIGKNTCPIE